MRSHPSLRRWSAIALSLLVCLFAIQASNAQTRTLPFNEREIEPQVHAFDKADTWTFHFRFKDPRIMTVDVPGRGKKIVWYLLYQIVNNTGEPRNFIPDFELKTDAETIHPDEMMPYVQSQIAKVEDPSGRIGIKNSVTISYDPIPISKKDAFPRVVTGVAIWTDVYDRAPKTNSFSIFIAGLSDGWKEDPNTKVIRRKTLQINFRRLGDEFKHESSGIRWIDNPQWIYRATDVNLGGEKKEMPPKEKVTIEPIRENNLPNRADKLKLDLLLPPPPVRAERFPDVRKE